MSCPRTQHNVPGQGSNLCLHCANHRVIPILEYYYIDQYWSKYVESTLIIIIAINNCKAQHTVYRHQSLLILSCIGHKSVYSLLGKDDESLNQPENVSVAEEEVEILTVPVDKDLFLQVAINSMCFVWSKCLFFKTYNCKKENVFHCLIYWFTRLSLVSVVSIA